MTPVFRSTILSEGSPKLGEEICIWEQLVPFFKSREMAMTTFLVILKVLMILIITGWVSIWFLRPTEIWKKSWQRAEDGLSTTIFQYLGLDILVFSLPIIIFAMIGLVYQHLSIRWRGIRQGRISINKFSVPVITRSPLGIISTAELVTATLFIIFLAWTFYYNISSDFKKMESPKSEKLNQWQLKVFKIGVRLGALSEICLVPLLFPVLRGVTLSQLLGLQFEFSVRYHIWLGNLMMLFATLHGVAIMFIWESKHNLVNELSRWQKTGRVNLAGVIGLATGLIIWVTSLPWIRRKKFEVFYYTHHLYIVYILFFLFHAGDRHFYLVFPGIVLFTIDKLLRCIQSRSLTSLISARIFPCKAVELVLPKHPDLEYSPTSMVFIKVPRISNLEWHPFTIASSSSADTDRISVIAKCQGQWTNALYKMIHDTIDLNASNMKSPLVAVEGPYGPLSNDYLRYDSLLLIAGGSGITPFLSIVQDAASINSKGTRSTPRMQLIYAVKKSEDLSMLSVISPLLLNQSTKRGLLKLQVFVTQEHRSDTTAREVLKEFSQVETAFFSTNSEYTMPRLESLPWIATITGLFSAIFLVSLGCLNRILHSEDKKKPTWIRDLCVIWAFIIATVCIILASCLLRWRKRTKEININFQKQATSTELCVSEEPGAPEEHEIHFGKRPDFQDILSRFPNQMGGFNVGVLVCGPESMHETVASFCRQSAHTFGKDAKRKPTFSFHSLNFVL